MTNVSPSLDRQAWTITISTEKKKKIKPFFVGLPQFWVSCRKCNSFFHCKTFSVRTESKSQQKFLRCTNMSHVLYFLFFFPRLFHIRELSRSCAGDSLFISRGFAFPTTQLSSPLLLRVYWSKQNESQDGHIEVSCDWLRWYSTESELLSEKTISSFFNFFFLVWTWCIVVPPFRPRTLPSHLQLSRCSPLRPQVGSQGWSGFFVFTVRKREWDRERKRESIHPCSFHPPPPRPKPRGCCDADWWARGERRGGFNWSGISGDQSMYWSVIRSSEWDQPLLSPTPTPVPPPPTPHFSPYQSSRTCRQRWPPLALHCQRMMQQRHRRWPPPCTEGGGVTGAK